jgi:hypothetical protein
MNAIETYPLRQTVTVTAAALLAVICVSLTPAPSSAQQGAGVLDTENLPVYLRDRGTGVPSSMFGTFIRKGELLFYPYGEYYRDRSADYSPEEFGFVDDTEYEGNYIAWEGLIFLGYGISDRLALEVEAAVIKARLDTSPNDLSGIARTLEESGLGDVETQLRYRWSPESERSPEIFSFLETVYPFQKDKDLIGTQDLELVFGSGIIKGFSWGTLVARAAVETADGEFDLGELAIEYIKRLSSRFRLYAATEGDLDTIELITELQWHVAPNIFLKLNNAFGATGATTEWAPEVGIMFSFPRR